MALICLSSNSLGGIVGSAGAKQERQHQSQQTPDAALYIQILRSGALITSGSRVCSAARLCRLVW